MSLLQAAEATKVVQDAATTTTAQLAKEGPLVLVLWFCILILLVSVGILSYFYWQQNKLRLVEANSRQNEIDKAVGMAREGWSKEQAINEGQHQSAMAMLKEQHKSELQYVKDIAESAQERLQEIQRENHQHDLKNVEIIKEVSHQMQNIVSVVTTSIATRGGEIQVLKEWLKEQFDLVNRNIDRNLEHLRRHP